MAANGENPNVNGRTHQTVNYLSCLIHPIIYYCHKLVEVVIAWEWEEYGQRNSNLGKNVFDFWGKLTPKMHAHLVIHPRSSSLHIVESWVLFYLHNFPVVCSPSRWRLLDVFLTIIHPRWGSLKRLGISCVWHSRFWVFYVCFTSCWQSFLHFP